MVSTTLLFAATWIAQLDGYRDDVIKTSALLLGVVAQLLLTAGGYMGGTLVFVYGIRVLKRRETPVSDALIPGRSNDTDDAGERPVIQDRPAVRN
jgi:hypothetical protein